MYCLTLSDISSLCPPPLLNMYFHFTPQFKKILTKIIININFTDYFSQNESHSRGVNFAGGEIGTSRCGSLHRFVGVVTDLGARSHDTSCESYS